MYVDLPPMFGPVMISMRRVASNDRSFGTNGVVVNKVVETRVPFTRDELQSIGRYITVEFLGMTLDVIRRRLIRMTEEERALHDEMLQKTIHLGIEAVGEIAPRGREIYVEGAASILKSAFATRSCKLRASPKLAIAHARK